MAILVQRWAQKHRCPAIIQCLLKKQLDISNQNEQTQFYRDSVLCGHSGIEIFFLSYLGALLLKVWSLDQQHQHHLEAFQKCKFLVPTPRVIESSIGWCPAIYDLTITLGNSDAHQRLRTTAQRHYLLSCISQGQQDREHTGYHQHLLNLQHIPIPELYV